MILQFQPAYQRSLKSKWTERDRLEARKEELMKLYHFADDLVEECFDYDNYEEAKVYTEKMKRIGEEVLEVNRQIAATF